MYLTTPVSENLERLEPLLIEFGQVPSNIYIYPGFLPPTLIGFLFLIGISFFIGLCVTILGSKLTNQDYINFKNRTLKASVITLLLIFLILTLEVIFQGNVFVGMFVTGGFLSALLLYVKISSRKSSYYEIGMTTSLFIVSAIFAKYLHFQTASFFQCFCRCTDAQPMINTIYLISLYVLPFAAIMIYRRKDPKFSEALPYKFISLCLFVTLLCVVIPMIDMLVADNGAR